VKYADISLLDLLSIELMECDWWGDERNLLWKRFSTF